MKDFERTIINELISGNGSNAIVFPESENGETVEFTGAGYFLTLKDSTLPISRVVLDKPDIRGQLDGICYASSTAHWSGH